MSDKLKLPWPVIRLSGYEIIGEARCKDDYGVVLGEWFCPISEDKGKALYEGAKMICNLPISLGQVDDLIRVDRTHLMKIIGLLKKGIGE